MNPGLALQYMEGLSEHVDFMGNLSGSFAKFPFAYTSGVAPATDNKFLLEASANINIKLLTDKYFVVPYFTLGLGASMYSGTYFAAYMPTGLGLQFNLGEGTFVHTLFGYNAKVSNLAINHLNYSIGIGSPITDKKEPKMVPPPPPPQPVAVVPEKDTDGDGIVDSKDKCPTVPGTAKYGGCPVPDTDGDGINDENDKCPDVKGVAKYQGCPIPDRDHDGINDEEDKCPDVAGVARYQGCPVPDRDHDGVNDEEDKCPDVPGVKENNGCPLVKEEVVQKVNTRAKEIFFQTNSAKLLPKSYKALNDVAAVLKEDAALKLDIEGHTDSTGGDKINIPLSKSRAKSVYDYIVSQGVDASKLSSEGYASSKPIATNKTPTGRALNRRVVLKLKYY
jgi:outer membrane protein OmpA-like peptidoglycan-associated protein